MSRPLLLDLFCCEGGAARGYWEAGFDVVGVDNVPRPLYPFPMVIADALQPPFDLTQFDAIHASPPCQAFSTISPNDNDHPNLIPATRELLKASGRPYVIENVQGAVRHLNAPAMLCGSSFGLGVQRHRMFESNWLMLSPGCQHGPPRSTYGIYGNHSGGGNEYHPDGTYRGRKPDNNDHARELMEMPWASWHGCTQAIPPAYTEYLGHQLLECV